MTPDPHCLYCGYNLRGLPLPRRCPECGHMANDETASCAATVQWYCSWRGTLLWDSPPLFFSRLDGSQVCRIAIRRLLIAGLLPWCIVLALVIFLSMIVCTTTYERWRESPAEPGRRRDADRGITEYRPFGAPGEFRLGFHVPLNFRAAPVESHIRFTTPRPDDQILRTFTALFAIAALPLFMAITIAGLAAFAARRTDGLHRSSKVLLPCLAWFIPPGFLLLLTFCVLGGFGSALKNVPEAIVIFSLMVGLGWHLIWCTVIASRMIGLLAPRDAQIRAAFIFLWTTIWILTNGIATFLIVVPLLSRVRDS